LSDRGDSSVLFFEANKFFAWILLVDFEGLRAGVAQVGGYCDPYGEPGSGSDGEHKESEK